MQLLIHPFTRERIKRKKRKRKKKTKTQKNAKKRKRKKTQKNENAYFQERRRIFSRTKTQKNENEDANLGERCQLSSGEYCIGQCLKNSFCSTYWFLDVYVIFQLVLAYVRQTQC